MAGNCCELIGRGRTPVASHTPMGDPHKTQIIIKHMIENCEVL